MNIKMLIAQLDLLPEAVLNGTINSIAYSVRRPMIMEAMKEEPNMAIIHTLRQLDEALTECGPDKMRSLEETALFVLNANPDDKDEVAKRNEVRSQLVRMAATGKIERPRSAAHLETLIVNELQSREDARADNFSKAIDAVMLIESCLDRDDENEITYDEAELPEWISDSIRDKILNIGLETFERARRDLARNPPPFSAAFTKASAARVGALALLDKFEITEDQVIGWSEGKIKNMEQYFAKLEEPVPTIDNPPVGTALPNEAAAVHKQTKRRAKGITSDDMKMANGQ